VGVGLLRRRHPEPAVELAELSGLCLVAAFLLSCFAWPYYGLFLVPTLMAAVRPGAAVRGWPALLAAYGLGGPDVRLWLMLGPAGHTLVLLRVTAGLLLLLLALARGVARRAG
jgi:arabinofuranan 3-O-arabinosyltransferase